MLRLAAWGGLVVLLLAGVMLLLGAAWPLAVTVDSGSMTPNIRAGDLLVLQTPDPVLPGLSAAATIRTAKSARNADVRSFGGYGSVVVFDVPDDGPAIVHRVHFQVAAGENWVARANDSFVSGNCNEVIHCPAPHGGYITKGDANDEYDQVAGVAPPVREEWVVGVVRHAIRLFS